MEQIRIAIADDHTLVRKSIASMLEADAAFHIIADAANGRELLEKLDMAAHPADVCLLDVSMPEMNGYQTLLALKVKYPAMRFLVLTQLEHEYIVVRMLKAGASGYMLKNAEPEELKKAIHTILEHSYYQSKLVNGRLFSLVQKGEEYKKLAITNREEEFLRLCCSELSYKEIAERMGITERTAAFYRESLFDKLDVNTRTALALFALKLGIVPMDEL
jgi:DNA-binding NarL/FixJ family response regulator